MQCLTYYFSRCNKLEKTHSQFILSLNQEAICGILILPDLLQWKKLQIVLFLECLWTSSQLGTVSCNSESKSQKHILKSTHPHAGKALQPQFSHVNLKVTSTEKVGLDGSIHFSKIYVINHSLKDKYHGFPLKVLMPLSFYAPVFLTNHNSQVLHQQTGVKRWPQCSFPLC